jgi:hypothetical protein
VPDEVKDPEPIWDLKERFYVENDGDGSKLVHHYQQHTQPHLDLNAKQKAEAPTWRPYAKGDFFHVARIPNIVAVQWMMEGINIFHKDDVTMKAVKAKLNSPEYAYLRTYPGRI